MIGESIHGVLPPFRNFSPSSNCRSSQLKFLIDIIKINTTLILKRWVVFRIILRSIFLIAIVVRCLIEFAGSCASTVDWRFFVVCFWEAGVHWINNLPRLLIPWLIVIFGCIEISVWFSLVQTLMRLGGVLFIFWFGMGVVIGHAVFTFGMWMSVRMGVWFFFLFISESLGGWLSLLVLVIVTLRIRMGSRVRVIILLVIFG